MWATEISQQLQNFKKVYQNTVDSLTKTFFNTMNFAFILCLQPQVFGARC